MKIVPRKIICILICLIMFPVFGQCTDKLDKDAFIEFLSLLKQNGWKSELSTSISSKNSGISVSEIGLFCEFLSDDGFYVNIDIIQLVYNDVNDTPLYDGKMDQVYSISYVGDLVKIGSDFTGDPVKFIERVYIIGPHYGGHHSDSKRFWNAYRIDNQVYIVHTGISKYVSDINSMTKKLMKFLRLKYHSDLDGIKKFKDEIKRKYEADREKFYGTKIIQEILSSLGYTDTNVDGILGRNTKNALQRFLKDEGYYKGKIDGLWGNVSIGAFKKYQKSLNVKATGKINVETATAIKNAKIK